MILWIEIYISLIINILFGVVGILLLVFVLMIIVIMYMLVVDWIKEIGILWVLGESKKDICWMFIVEFLIIGIFLVIVVIVIVFVV